MAIWDIDLETRMGAESAASQGSLACFLYAGMTAFSGALVGASMGFDTPEFIATAVILGLQLVLCIIGGIRLRMGKGAYIGMAVAAVIALNLVSAIATLSIGLGLILSALMLLFVIQGVRGALALRNSHFDEDDYAAFE